MFATTGDYTTFDPALDAIYREMDGLQEAIYAAYEAVAEDRMSAFVELGRDFTYQTFPSHIHAAHLEAEMRDLEALVALRIPPAKAPAPVVYDDDAPF